MTIRSSILAASLMLIVFYAGNQTLGSDETLSTAALKDWLAKPILANDQPQAEIERYLETRIPRLPSFATREAWERYAEKLRQEMLDKIVVRGQGTKWLRAPLKVEWQDVLHGGEEYRIKKLRFEAIPGLWIPALLYEPLRLSGPTAVSLNINGHDSNGKAAVYKQIRCINQAKRGMLALNVEWLGMGQLRGKDFAHSRMNQLDLCGTCGLAPFYLSMKRALDVLLSHPHADSGRVAVSGLSGGGWQTIFISALDTRVTLANPVAGYSSFLTRIHHHSDLGDSEQTPNDMATVGDYAHLTALLAPRPALLTYNVKDDCCFASGHALQPLLDAATPFYQLFDREKNLRSHVNHDPGTHNFERDNREAFYRLLWDHFFAGQPKEWATEIDCQSEIKTAEQLLVSLPPVNADFNSLARELAESLPHDKGLPSDRAKALAWQRTKTERLKELLQVQDYAFVAEISGEEAQSGMTIKRYRFRTADSWTVPVLELAPDQPTGTTIVIADGGRNAAVETVQQLLLARRRVITFDPFYVGESKLKNRAYLWALLIQTVGNRPAGIQTSQFIALSKWLKQQRPQESIELDVRGPRLTLAALSAAALEPLAFDSVHIREGLPTLKDVIVQDLTFDSHPELFAFGLLEEFDFSTITALCAPREVQWVEPSERHRTEFSQLKGWYRLLGKEFDPVK